MGNDNYDWAALVMSRMTPPATPTSNNVDNFTRWMRCENPANVWWHFNNPLNCGLDDGSADGAGSYPNLDFAATETARVLSQSNMAPIANALRADASLAVFSAGCAYAAWSTGGYHDVPGYVASVPMEPVIVCPESFTSVGVSATPPPPANPTPAVPLPANAPSITQEEIIMGLPSGCTDIPAVQQQIKEWWVTFRTDVCTVAAINLLTLCWTLPEAQGGFAGSPFALFNNIVDGSVAHPAPIRPVFAGAV